MSIRSELRVTDWNPQFTWVSSIQAAADIINRPHEDYPHRVGATASEIDRLGKMRLPPTVSDSLLLEIHRAVFADTSFAGQLKGLDVLLSPSRPTKVSRVSDWMSKLESEYQGRITDLNVLREWHLDFETIHPFLDGNGRTGGIIVATYSHQMHPGKGWLVPKQ